MFTATPNWALTSDPAISITTTVVRERLAEAIIQEAVEEIMVVRPGHSVTVPAQAATAAQVQHRVHLQAAVPEVVQAVLPLFVLSQEEAINL